VFSHSAGVKEKVIKNKHKGSTFSSISTHKNNPTTKKYWEEIGLELIEVNEILKNKSVINNNSP